MALPHVTTQFMIYPLDPTEAELPETATESLAAQSQSL